MDKREAVRIPVKVQAQCRSVDVVVDGLVEDVSRSGLFLRTLEQVQLGATAELDLALPDEQHLRLAVEVVRIESEPGRTGLGLRFTDPTHGNRRPLANFIMRVHSLTE